MHVLGFKFQYYNGSASRQTPDSLLQLTAHLTKAGLVDVSFFVFFRKFPLFFFVSTNLERFFAG